MNKPYKKVDWSNYQPHGTFGQFPQQSFDKALEDVLDGRKVTLDLEKLKEGFLYAIHPTTPQTENLHPTTHRQIPWKSKTLAN